MKTSGISFTNKSLNIPPPTAVKIPAKVKIRKFKPNKLYAMVAPIILNTPRPIASNFKNKPQCLFSDG
jgi:hypothetical protein